MTTLEQFGADFFFRMMFGTITTVYNTTGCQPQCVVSQYDVQKYHLASNIQYRESTESTHGHNIIFLVYKNGAVSIETQAPFYDINNFIGEVGGSLGFFLGASLISLFDKGRSIFQRILSKMTKKG